jgi:hypothetical protein
LKETPVARIPATRSKKWKRIKSLSGELGIRPSSTRSSTNNELDQEIEKLTKDLRKEKSRKLTKIRALSKELGLRATSDLTSASRGIDLELTNLQQQKEELQKTKKYVLKGKPFGNSKFEDFGDPYLVHSLIRSTKLKKNVRVILVVNQRVTMDVVYRTATGQNFSRQVRADWTLSRTSADTNMIYDQPDKRVVIIIQPETDIPATKIAQRFRQGKTHCVIEPIKKWIEKKIPKPGTRDSRGYRKKFEKLNEYEKQYDAGMTIEDIQKMCDTIGIDVHISDIFDNSTITIKSKKQTRNTFKFTNTKLDHVDLLTVNSDAIKLDISEMQEKYDELSKQEKGFIYGRNTSRITWISTAEHYYKLYTKVDKMLETFVEDNELEDSHYIHHDEPYSKLVRNSLHQCGYALLDMDYDGEQVRRIDHEKSYINYENCDYFQGFPFKFTEYRRVKTDNNKKFLEKHIGLYHVTITKSAKWARAIRTYQEGDHSFPSVELLFLLDHGVEFTINYGCWTQIAETDLMFSESSREKDEDGPRFYQKMIGIWSSLKESYTVNIDGPREWAEYLKTMYQVVYHPDQLDAAEGWECWGNDYDQDDNYCKTGRISIEFPKDPKKVKHMNHIAAFLTSYSRIQVLQQFIDIYQTNPDDVVAILTDEIALCQFQFHSAASAAHSDSTKRSGSQRIRRGFREKNSDKPLPSYHGQGFLSSYNEPVTPPEATISYLNGEYQRQYHIPDPPPKSTSDRRTHIHIGPGGSGKTYSVLSDPGYLRLLYTAPPHKLRNKKQQEFPNIRTEVVHNIHSGWASEKYKHGSSRDNIISPSVIVIDESTQLSEEIYDTIEYMYDCLIILCGDHSEDGKTYQLPCIGGDPVADFSKMSIHKHIKNRRAKCEELKKILNWLRDNMFTKKDQELQEYIIDKVSTITPNQVKDHYTINDYILTGYRTSTTKGVKYWTERLKFQNKKLKNKYLTTKKTKDHFNGEIIITDDPPLKSWEPRHAFTCHQIQGETVKEKIFIDIHNMFNFAQMLYVALSRAEYLEQIFIID